METLREDEAVIEGGQGVGETGGFVFEPESKDKDRDRVVYDLNEEGSDNSVVVVNRKIVVTETTTVEMRCVRSENIKQANNVSDVSVEDNELNGNGISFKEHEVNGNEISHEESENGGVSLLVDAHVSVERVNEESAEEEVGIRVDEGLYSENGENFENFGEMIERKDRKRVGEDFKDCDENGEIVGQKKHNFAVGDFVWVKIKSHIWWPGQVYDPYDASEFASKFKHEDQLLIAYFGDGSCAWCFPTKLIPFAEHFEEMAKQSDSKAFENAVKDALDEISRRVELEMICYCVAIRDRVDLARPQAVNAGIKTGVLVSEGDISKLGMPCYEPAEVLEYVRCVAKAGSVTNMLELAFVKSWLAAFYFIGRGCLLPLYHKPQEIEGLEDKSENVAPETNDFRVPIEVPIKGPFKEDCISLPTTGQGKGPLILDEKLNQSRKQKSVAELMREENADPKPKSLRKSKGEEDTKKKKKAKKDSEMGSTNLEFSTTGMKRGGKMKSETAANEGVQLEEKVDEAPLSNKRKENEDFGDHMEGEAKEESGKSHMSRERKKSKYLSPPYTSHSWDGWKLNKKRELETKWEKITKVARVGERISEVAEPLFASPPISKCNGEVKKTAEGRSSRAEKSGKSPRIVFQKEKKIIDSKDVNASVPEVLFVVRSACVNFMSLEDSSLETIKGFVTAFRSSIYMNGSNYKSYHEEKAFKKRNSSVPKSRNVADEINQANTTSPQPPTHNEKIERPGSRVTKLKKVARAAATRVSPVSLIVAFTPGATLPSKEEIIKIFGKYGNVNEDETEVLLDSNSAQVAYTSISDAEEAFRECIKQSPLGASSSGFRLRYSSASARALESGKKFSMSPKKMALRNRVGSQATDEEISEAGLVREKLEMLKSMLEKCDGKISPEEKSSMESEMRSLLEKVSGMAVKTLEIAS